MGGENHPASKWEGSVSVQVHGVEPDQAWSLVGDFCNISKYFPSMASSVKVDGPDGLPGCIRHTTGKPDKKTGLVRWYKERLIEIDHAKRSYSYDIVESSAGFEGYFATLKVTEGDGGCMIEWVFEVEPIVGWTQDYFVGLMAISFKGMAKIVEDTFRVC